MEHDPGQPRALVTGGAGFIGSHLVNRLLDDGWNVTVVDDFSSSPTNDRKASDAPVSKLDIADPALADVFSEHQPQTVFHLAAQVSVARSMREPELDVHTNIVGGINLLQQCVRFGVKRVVLFSTGGALYGDPEYLPCDEAHPIKPLSVYGASKHALEQYTRIIARANGIEYVILRPGNVYGPGQDPHGESGVFAIFGLKMLAGEGVTVHGDGEQVKDYVYVDDVVAAGVTAALPEVSAGSIYNIGSGVPTSVNQIFALLAAETGYIQTPVHAPERPGDVRQIYLDTSKARRELGWTPEIDLREGISRTVAALRRTNGMAVE